MMNIVPKEPWLYLEEQRAVVEKLLEWELIKFSNKRDLPLKSGGTTDIYINLRNARNNPEAIRFLAEDVFTIPFRRLDLDRFVEVPDAVSCFAGPLAVATCLPYLTIRKEAKEGRVADAKVIGDSRSGERVCILDDVITDGASKIAPLSECDKRGLYTRALAVLVDRQQGWQRTFAKEGITTPVWAGMTLHDVRRLLVRDLAVMERCDPRVEDANPIIVALDGKSWDEILPIIDRLRPTGCILKVNDAVFNEGILRLVPNLSVYGRVMVDLKCHDIPNTVANTCAHLRAHEPWAVTVHGTGGPAVEAAKQALAGCSTKVLVITVLTSIDEKTGEEIYSRRPLDEVRVLAEMTKNFADGFVCSPEEVAELRHKYPNKWLVTPGIRSAGIDADDQKRIATPKVAIERGANRIVMGRQILGSADPTDAVCQVLREIRAIKPGEYWSGLTD